VKRSWFWAASLLGVGTAHAQQCPLWSVKPPGLSIAVDFEGTRLSRASLVQKVESGACADPAEVHVQVRAVNHWYREKGAQPPAIDAQGCLGRGLLGSLDQHHLVGIGPPPEGGARASALELGQYTTGTVGTPECSATTVPILGAGIEIPLAQLADTRVVPRHLVQRIKNMGGQPQPYRKAGQTPIQMVSDWGYVSLPVVQELSSYELEQEWVAEDLQTPAQRERATVAIGARTESGGVIYTHFLGSDARRSDRWATAHTVSELSLLTRAWYRHCTEDLPGRIRSANPRTCSVQLGDLAWYNNRSPDPLGHDAHRHGTCVDIRLFRSDGSRYEALWNKGDDRPGYEDGYDPSLTTAFLQFANETVDIEKLYFNDPEVVARVPGLEPRHGHDDHIHLCIRQP